MKLKRLLTAALSAVMALSVCALPAMAADGTTTPNPVWSQNHGSITIHKYEWNGTNGNYATGEDNVNQLPNDTTTTPSPLKDAEFTLYEVKGAAWLKAYYSGKPGDTIQASVFDWNTYAEKDTTSGDYKLKTNAPTVKKVGTQTTNEAGIAKFDKVKEGETEKNLPLGLYLVMETKSPDQVTTPCEPFLVSVPMTRVGATNPQSDWLYDVHVYPKNRTSYGNITLTKMGQVGNSTDTAALSGVTFKLYKFVGTKNADGKINAITSCLLYTSPSPRDS